MARKAMVFAAGRGTRLGELGRNTPKALIEVAGVPMLERILKALSSCGIQEVVINLHHLGHKIREYLDEEKSFGLTIHYSEEKDLLDTGGGLKRAASYFDDDDIVLVHNCDIYTDCNLDTILQTHEASEAIASLVLSKRETSRVLLVDTEDNLVGWRNKKTGEEILVKESESMREMAYGGIQIITGRFLPYLEGHGEAFWIFHSYFQAVSDNQCVRGIDIGKSLWWDIGTPERISELEAFLKK